jgi:hypothetical protein
MSGVRYAREIKGVLELEDGTRVYKNYVRYKPVPLDQRKYKVNKPDDPSAFRHHGYWLLPLPLIDDEARSMPETRPDTDAYDHMTKPRKCKCVPCQRPEAVKWQDKWRDDMGIPRKRKRRKKRSLKYVAPVPPVSPDPSEDLLRVAGTAAG